MVTGFPIRLEGDAGWTCALVPFWLKKAEIAAESIVMGTIMKT